MEIAIVGAIFALIAAAGALKWRSVQSESKLEERTRIEAETDRVARSAGSAQRSEPVLAGPLPSSAKSNEDAALADASGDGGPRPLSTRSGGDDPASTGGYRMAGQRRGDDRYDSLRLALERIATTFLEALEGDTPTLDDVLLCLRSANDEMVGPLVNEAQLTRETYVIMTIAHVANGGSSPINVGDRPFDKQSAPHLVAATERLQSDAMPMRDWLLPSLLELFVRRTIEPRVWQSVSYVIASASKNQITVLDQIMGRDRHRDEVAKFLVGDPGTRAALSYEATMKRVQPTMKSDKRQKHDARGRKELLEANRALERLINNFHPNREPAITQLTEVAAEYAALLREQGFATEGGALVDGVSFIAKAPTKSSRFLTYLRPGMHVPTVLALGRTLLSGKDPHRNASDAEARLTPEQLSALSATITSPSSQRFLANLLVAILREPDLELALALDVPRLFVLAGSPKVRDFFYDHSEHMAWWVQSDEVQMAHRFVAHDKRRRALLKQIEAAEARGDMTATYRLRAGLKSEGLDELPEDAEQAALTAVAKLRTDDPSPEDDEGGGTFDVLRSLRDGLMGRMLDTTESASSPKPRAPEANEHSRSLASAFDVHPSLLKPTTPRQRFLVRRVALALDADQAQEALKGLDPLYREHVLIKVLVEAARAPLDVLAALKRHARDTQDMEPTTSAPIPEGLCALFLPLVEDPHLSEESIPFTWFFIRMIGRVASKEDVHALSKLPNRLAEDQLGVYEVWSQAAGLANTNRRRDSSKELAKWLAEDPRARFYLDQGAKYRESDEILERILRWALEQCDLTPAGQPHHEP